MRRSQHVRWLIVGPIAGLAMIVAGVVALEAVHPQRDLAGMRVEGVPALAIDSVETCIRRADDTNVDELRASVAAGTGRISSLQVYACPQAYDGLRVRFAGEAIGELIRRDGGVWVQVNDDAYALEVGPVIGHREHAGFNTGLSVWLPDGLHEQISGVGLPGQRGDVLLIDGTLLRADPDDGGGITLRAASVEVLAEATPVDTPIHTLQIVVALALAVSAAGAVAWSRQRRRL